MNDLDREKIERYLRDELSTEEKNAFENEINKDKALAEEVLLHRATDDLSFVLLEDSLKEKMSGWDTTQPGIQRSKRRFFMAWLTAGLLLGFAGWWFSGRLSGERPSQTPIQPDSIPKKDTDFPTIVEIKPEMPPSKASDSLKLKRNTTLADAFESKALRLFPSKQALKALFPNQMGIQNNDVFQQGIDWINKGRFSEASIYFQQVASAGKLEGNSRGNLLYGYACFYNRDYPCAERCFRKALADTPIFKSESEWMLCLTLYAQQGPKGNPFLIGILKNTEHPFWNDAQQLQKKDLFLK